MFLYLLADYARNVNNLQAKYEYSPADVLREYGIPQHVIEEHLDGDVKKLADRARKESLELLERDNSPGSIVMSPPPEQPSVDKVIPKEGPLGTELKITLNGKHLNMTTAVAFEIPGAKVPAKVVKADGLQCLVKATFPKEGSYTLRVANSAQVNALRSFLPNAFLVVGKT